MRLARIIIEASEQDVTCGNCLNNAKPAIIMRAEYDEWWEDEADYYCLECAKKLLPKLLEELAQGVRG